MNELKKNLKEAFDLLATIPVQGNNVDIMHAARVKLRIAYQLAEAADKKEEVKEDA